MRRIPLPTRSLRLIRYAMVCRRMRLARLVPAWARCLPGVWHDLAPMRAIIRAAIARPVPAQPWSDGVLLDGDVDVVPGRRGVEPALRLVPEVDRRVLGRVGRD